MKFLPAISIILLLSCNKLEYIPIIKAETSNIQKQADDGEIICVFYLEKHPEFIGGDSEMYKYISKHLQTDENESKISDKIMIRFDVLEDGTVDNVEIVKGAEKSPILRQNLIRIFKSMPKWKPGENSDGKVIKMKMIYPVILEFD